MHGFIIAGVLLGALTAGPITAQVAGSGSGPGRIRITPTDSRLEPIVGTAVSSDGQTLRMVPAGRSDTLSFSMASIDKVEASAGKRSQAGRGALIGGAVGLALGGGAALLVSPQAADFPEWVPGAALAGTTLLGALVGTLIGARSSRETWTASPSVTVNPATGGMDFGMQMRVGIGGGGGG